VIKLDQQSKDVVGVMEVSHQRISLNSDSAPSLESEGHLDDPLHYLIIIKLLRPILPLLADNLFQPGASSNSSEAVQRLRAQTISQGLGAKPQDGGSSRRPLADYLICHK
jgi:hypothetical protein